MGKLGKLIIVKKEQLKISPEEFEKRMRKDKLGTIILKNRDSFFKEKLKPTKESK